METMTGSSQLNILSVEDNDGDSLLVKTAFFTISGRVSVSCVKSGGEALKFLRREAPYAGAPRPHLVFLDLNMPGMSGRETLERIKGDPALEKIPVIILSGSMHEDDVADCYRLKANCYLQKPVGFIEFVKLLSAVNRFWGRKETSRAASNRMRFAA